MSYHWVEHTGELELEIVASCEADVFVDALAALAELLGDDDGCGSVSREVRVVGDGRAELLVGWLEELVYLSETEHLLPDAVEWIEFAGGGVVARVGFRRGDPRPVVKGATYHRLAFASTGDGFCARVVLDV